MNVRQLPDPELRALVCRLAGQVQAEALAGDTSPEDFVFLSRRLIDAYRELYLRSTKGLAS